jgi:hypothetical protein
MAKRGKKLYEKLEGWEDFPPAWKPIPGEVLVGTVELYDTWEGKYGPVKVVVLRDEAGGSLVSVYLGATVLFEEFKKLRPRPGEIVGIRYFGKDEDRGYHKYKVMVDRPDTNVDVFFATEGAAAVPDDDVPL